MREEGLGVGGKVIGAVGGVETFGEDYEGGAGAGGSEDVSSGAGEVLRFVRAYIEVSR